MGYDTDIFVDQNIDSNLICHVCHGVLEEPVVACKEGHTFCRKCLKKVIAGGGGDEPRAATCPTCRGTIVKKATSSGVCRPLKNMILAMRVRCGKHDRTIDRGDETKDGKPKEGRPAKRSRKDAENGGCGLKDSSDGDKEITEGKLCNWEGPLLELNAHNQSDCEYFAMRCPIGCGKKIIRRELENHKETCGHRKVACALCEKRLRSKDLARHNERVCPEVEKACSFCGQLVKRKAMGKGPRTSPTYVSPQGCQAIPSNALTACKDSQCTGHLKSCLKAPIYCEFKGYGCNVIFSRETAADHYAENAGTHAYLVNKRIDGAIQNATKGIDDVRKNAGVEPSEIVWKIPPRKLEGNGSKMLRSKSVPFAGFEFYLRLDMQGQDDEVELSICAVDPRYRPVQIDGIHVKIGGQDDATRVDVHESDDDGRFYNLTELDGSADHGLAVDIEYSEEDDDDDDGSSTGAAVTRASLLNLILEAGINSVFIQASFRVQKVRSVCVGCA